jgi:hypothetical protein
MPLPHDLTQKLDHLARGFKQFPKNPSSKVHKAIREVLAEIAYKSDCADVLNQDWDGEGGSRPQLNPDIPFETVYEFYGDEWTSVLRKADTAFDRLCQDFLDAVADDPRAPMDADEATKILDKAIQENFWSEFGADFDGEKFSDVYDDVRGGCPEYTDPHEYHGESRRDFMASRRASDRSSLLRIASSLPAGDAMRRAILAGLSKSALTVGTVRAFIEVAASKLTQYDQRLEAKQPNMYRLGHYFRALDNVRGDVKGVMDDASPEALGVLRASFERRFLNLAPINATIKQIDEYLASGKLPSLGRR